MPTTKKPTKKPITNAKKKTPASLKKIRVAQLLTLDAATIAGAGKSHLSDFLTFVREQGVIGLAVGLAVGTAAGAAVKQIVDGLINPVVGFIIGGIDLAQQKWVVVAPGANAKGGLIFSWGAILSSFITLFATILVIYWVVHVAKLGMLDKKKDE